MVKEAVNKVGTYYYFFPTYNEGKKILWNGIDKEGFKFLNHIPTELVKRNSGHEMLVELVNGSIIQIIGTDNVDSIVGTNPIGCVFSEYSLQNPIAWGYIRPTLQENGGWAIFNYTSRGRNHGYTLLEYLTIVKRLWNKQLFITDSFSLGWIDDCLKYPDQIKYKNPITGQQESIMIPDGSWVEAVTKSFPAIGEINY